MVKTRVKLLLLLLFIFFYHSSISQNSVLAESVITYDKSNPENNRLVPFDHAFTLQIKGMPTKDIRRVDIFEAQVRNGNRRLMENTIKDENGDNKRAAIVDGRLYFTTENGIIRIAFPPLKPDKDFDVMVVYGLLDGSRSAFLKASALLAQSKDATAAFRTFVDSTTDQVYHRTNCSLIHYSDFKTFFNSSLASHFTTLGNLASFLNTGSLNQAQIQAIDIATSKAVSDFKDGGYLVEICNKGLFSDILLGQRAIDKVFLTEAKGKVDLYAAEKRLVNFETNINYFDSLRRRVDRTISTGVTSVAVAGVSVDLISTKTTLDVIWTELQKNKTVLSDEIDAINAAIDTDQRLQQGVYVSLNNLSSDLKTKGASVLFVDLGMSNIFAPSLVGKATYIPKLYTGVSIYFRPIDKNTRRNRFKDKFPDQQKGCIFGLDAQGNKTEICGPDYGVFSRATLLQRLSLNIGLTFGTMTAKDFDNFYNGTSLLVGPAYRFARAFKVSAGAAILKRNSKNPLISDKQVVVGQYISLSADVDFLQAIKDITSILFK